MKVTLPLGYFVCKKKKSKNPNCIFAVERMLVMAELNINKQCNEIRDKTQNIVSGVCSIGSCFIKNCICVQLYEDTVAMMTNAMKKGALFCNTRRLEEGAPCVETDNPNRVYADMYCLYCR